MCSCTKLALLTHLREDAPQGTVRHLLRSCWKGFVLGVGHSLGDAGSDSRGSQVWLRSGLDAVGKRELVCDYLDSYPEKEKSTGRRKLGVVKQQYSLTLARTKGWLAIFLVGWWSDTVAQWPCF